MKYQRYSVLVGQTSKLHYMDVVKYHDLFAQLRKISLKS